MPNQINNSIYIDIYIYMSTYVHSFYLLLFRYIYNLKKKKCVKGQHQSTKIWLYKKEEQENLNQKYKKPIDDVTRDYNL